MADIINAYCSVIDIQDITLPKRSYSTTTRPTTSQVEKHAQFNRIFLDQKFRGKGIILPIVDEEVLKTVRYLNALGTAAIIETILHGASEPNPSQFGVSLQQQFKDLLTAFLDQHKLPTTATNEERASVPQDDLYSTMASIWDTSSADSTLRESMFKIDTEW